MRVPLESYVHTQFKGRRVKVIQRLNKFSFTIQYTVDYVLLAICFKLQNETASIVCRNGDRCKGENSHNCALCSLFVAEVKLKPIV